MQTQQAVVRGRSFVFAARGVTQGGELRGGRLLGSERRVELTEANRNVGETRPARGLAGRVADIPGVRFHPGASDATHAKFPARRHPGFGLGRFMLGAGYRTQQSGQSLRFDAGAAAHDGNRGHQPVRQGVRARRPYGQDDIVRTAVDHGAFRKHPRVEEPAGLQGRLQSRPGGARNVGCEIDELPQGCPDPLAADRGVPGVGRGRRLVFAGLETAAFRLQLALLERQSAALVGYLGRARGELLFPEVTRPIERCAHGIGAAQARVPGFQLVQDGIEVGDVQRLRGVSVEPPGGEELGAAFAQLPHQAFDRGQSFCGAARRFGSGVEGIGMERSSVVRAGADLHGRIHVAQSFADHGNLVAAARLGFAPLPKQSRHGVLGEIRHTVG